MCLSLIFYLWIIIIFSTFNPFVFTLLSSLLSGLCLWRHQYHSWSSWLQFGPSCIWWTRCLCLCFSTITQQPLWQSHLLHCHIFSYTSLLTGRKHVTTPLLDYRDCGHSWTSGWLNLNHTKLPTKQSYVQKTSWHTMKRRPMRSQNESFCTSDIDVKKRCHKKTLIPAPQWTSFQKMSVVMKRYLELCHGNYHE